MRPPAPHTTGLTRKSTGLTPAHVQLIKLLAEIAIADYLRETETTSADDRKGAVAR